MHIDNNLWKLYNEVPHKNQLLGDERYKLHLYRLKQLIKLEEFKDLNAIYMTDYKQDILGESKWNWEIPIVCRAKKIDLLKKALEIQADRRTKIENYSFSDFMFRDLNKKCIIKFFKCDNKSQIYFEDLKFCSKIYIGIENTFINEVTLEHSIRRCKNKWDLINIKKDILEKNKEFDTKFISSKFNSHLIKKFQSIINIASESNIDIKIATISWNVIVSSLSVRGIESFTYIPSSIFKEKNEEGFKEVSSGGFIIPQFSDEQSLTSEQEEILYLIAQRWFSINAVSDFETKTKKEEWQHIFSITEHNIKNFLRGIETIENQIIDKSIENENILPQIKYFRTKILDLINLSKSSLNPEKYLENIDRKGSFNIIEVIEKVILLYENCFKYYLDNRIMSNESVLNAYKRGKFWKISKLDDVMVPRRYESIFLLIISELIYNAIRNNQPKAFVRISLRNKPEGTFLIISNNLPIRNKYKKIFVDKINIEKVDKEHYGIIILNIWINFLGCKISIPTPSAEDKGMYTKIILEIPKLK